MATDAPEAFGGKAGRAHVVDYSASRHGVNVNLATGKGSGSYAQGDKYGNIRDVVGSGLNDMIVGDANDNVVRGGRGTDSRRAEVSLRSN